MKARAQLKVAIAAAYTGSIEGYKFFDGSRVYNSHSIIDEAGDGSEITSLRELFNTDDRSDIMDAYNDYKLQFVM